MVLRWKIAQWFEAWWWRRYLRSKSVQEYLDWKQAYWKKFLSEAEITLPISSKVLDAGCGPAGVFMVFPKNEVWAVDPLLGKYETELGHFEKVNFPNVKFVESALEDYSKTDYFDCIFCLNVINHVRDIEKSIENLYSNLKKGGLLYLSVDAHNFTFLKHLFQLIPGDILHPHQLDLKGYFQLVENVGFEIKRHQLIKKEGIFSYYLIVAEK